MSVLLVEDQSLIAMDTEELLRSIGAEEVSIAANVATALKILSEESPDCAVLDLNLGSSTSEDVAKELEKRGIPYIFATGYRDGVHIPADFSTVPVVRKPVSQAALASVFGTTLGIVPTGPDS